MELAQRRGELISRKLAFSQLGYLLVAFRQRTLLAPAQIARRLVLMGFVDPAKQLSVSEAIKEDIHTANRTSGFAGKSHRPGLAPNDWLRRIKPQANTCKHLANSRPSKSEPSSGGLRKLK